jgi:phosphoribosylformylglycinamidine synthase
MLSESQERMLLVAERGREAEVLAVFAKWGLDAVVIGRVTDDGLLRVRQHGEVVAEIPAHPLAEEGPVYQRPLRAPALRSEEQLVKFADAGALLAAPRGGTSASPTSIVENFRALLASPAIASKRWIFEQYDHMVRTNTVVVPGAGDAAVMRVKGTSYGLALATDCNARWCALDPRLGAMHAVAEAARNVACSGARPVAVTNCLNFGNPEKPETMWQFSEAIDGMAEACAAFSTPVTGGNVSFYNETLGRGIFPTPTIGMLGILDDVSRALGMGFRAEGDAIILLDGAGAALAPLMPDGAQKAAPLRQFQMEFSSSEYAKRIYGIVAGAPPAIDLAAEKRLIDALVALASESALHSAHDVSDGGLAVALAECCFTSNQLFGAIFQFPISDFQPPEYALFGERGARAVVSCAPESLARVEAIARQYGVAARSIGLVSTGDFRIEDAAATAIAADTASLREIWAKALENGLCLTADG